MYKILVVDDNKLEREGIKFLLKKKASDLTIDEAGDGLEAVKKTKLVHYNLLITDIKMPYMDGIELVKKIRTYNQDMKIIVLSGYEEFEYVKELLRYNVVDYLLKPLKVEVFYDTLKKIGFFRELEQYKSSSIKKTLQIIQTEYASDLNLESLAENVFLSGNYLSTLFKQEVGISITKYITQVRLEKASTLLKDSHMKVSQIAKYIGIENVSYFNKIFKEKTGLTPSEWVCQ